MRTPSIVRMAAVLALLAEPAQAQTPPAGMVPTGPGRIMGQVTGADGAPLATVAVTIRSASDSSLVTGELTGEDGRFRVDGLATGEYLLRVSLIGYLSRNSEVIRLSAESPTVDLGAIALQVSAVELAGVAAEVERSQVVIEADRTIYNTKSMPVASAGSATDVLRAVPELEVDVNDNVKLRGNQSVAVHLNGRPAPLRGEQLANFLKQLPGNRIQRVEVMPNPSAKHDPEGMGGIVNIVLADDLDLGLSGSVSANASTRNRQFFNGRLNYQKGRVTFFTGAGINTYSNDATTYDLRQNLIARPVTRIEQSAESDNRSWGWNGDWTAELKVGEKGTLWTNAWLYWSANESDGLAAYSITSEDDVLLDRYDRRQDSEFSYGNFNFGAGYKHIFEQQKQELTIDGRYSDGNEDSDRTLANLYEIVAGAPVDMPLELTLNDVAAGSGDLSVQADYFRPLLAGKLELGYRAWRRDQDNDNLLRVFDSPDAADPREHTRSGYDYEETFHSLYATFGRTWQGFGVQAGVRAELSRTHFDSRVGGAPFDREYNTLFPSFNVSYTVKPGRTVRLLYSKRISRPSAYYLDPYVPVTDPLNISVGNPDLRPSYSQSISMDFSWMGGKGTLRVAPYYRSTTDVWERIRTVDTLGVATSRFENAASAKAYGSNFTVSLPPTGKLSGSTSFSVYRDVRDGTNISSAYRRSGWLWSVGANLGYKVTPTLTAQAFANHFPTQSILQGRASGYTFTQLALRQQLFDGRGSVSLNISDPLNLYKYNSSTRDATYVQESRSSFNNRYLTLGFTFNFGKPPQQQSRRGGDGGEAGETIRVR